MRRQDFRPRLSPPTQQGGNQLAKAASLTSLAPKQLKGKAAKGAKARAKAAAAAAAAAARARKGEAAAKRNDRVVWDAHKRRSDDRGSSGRQFADAARLHQVVWHHDPTTNALFEETPK